MRHYYIVLLAASLILGGCNSNQKPSETDENLTKEIETIDSTTAEMEKAREDIEQMSEELDTLIDNL
jgi:PBP1b-binding outer membrane lipoprotein LpoB